MPSAALLKSRFTDDQRSNITNRCRVACSRRSDSGARVKNKAQAKNERRSGKKNKGKLGKRTVSPCFFPLFRSFFACALFFARALISERLEQARRRAAGVHHTNSRYDLYIVTILKCDALILTALFSLH